MNQGKILVIAGSDSSGGAGLEADQKTIAAHGCYAMTATTALTAQNTLGVYDIHLVPPAFLKKQLDACFDDIAVDVVKTGMLASGDTIDLVAATLRERKANRVVIDPVMVSTSGAQLLPPGATENLIKLAGLAFILTPNIPELKLLLDHTDVIENLSDLEGLARLACQKLGSTWVLVKGGHLPFKKDYTVAEKPCERQLVVNILAGPLGQTFRIESEFQDSKNTHGTGCTLASAIASNLAKGMDAYPAVRAASHYIEASIRYAPGYGKGHGPLNHFHSLSILPFSRGHFLDYLINRPDVADLWKRFVRHPFVQALGNGTLPMESFKGYLVQDYLYLVHFARANALASYKSKDMKDVSRSANVVQHLGKEMELHMHFCSKFGIAKQDIEEAEEQTACTAYTRYILDVGQSEDWFALQMALAPCTIGYCIAARALHEDHETTNRTDNPYWAWVENYVADDYKEVVETTSARIEEHAALQSPTRIEQLVKIFVHCTKMEIAFWEMYKHAED